MNGCTESLRCPGCSWGCSRPPPGWAAGREPGADLLPRSQTAGRAAQRHDPPATLQQEADQDGHQPQGVGPHAAHRRARPDHGPARRHRAGRHPHRTRGRRRQPRGARRRRPGRRRVPHQPAPAGRAAGQHRRHPQRHQLRHPDRLHQPRRGHRRSSSRWPRASGFTVINGVRVDGVQQVQLDVVIARVDRTKGRNFGFNFLINARNDDLRPDGRQRRRGRAGADRRPGGAAPADGVRPDPHRHAGREHEPVRRRHRQQRGLPRLPAGPARTRASPSSSPSRAW